jgi:hypothetical protein
MLICDYNQLLVMRLYCNTKQTLTLILCIAVEKIHMSPCVLPHQKIMILTYILDKGELMYKLKQEKTQTHCILTPTILL